MVSKEEIFSGGKIVIKGARENNLKNVDLIIPKNRLVVFTGPSGSGKSTLAFDTIYIEGQRRYVESLSPYARQFLGLSEKPDFDSIFGLTPTISIDQKTVPRSPRSTVGTITEVYDYLRLLFAKVGIPTCPICGAEIGSTTKEEILSSVLDYPKNTRLLILSPQVENKKGEHREILEKVKSAGFSRVMIDGEMIEIRNEIPQLDKNKRHDIDIVVDRVSIPEEISSSFRERVSDSLATSLQNSGGVVKIMNFGTKEVKIYSENFSCPVHKVGVPKLTPASFSFNSPQGACPECGGLGVKLEVDIDLVIPNKSISIDEGAIAPWNSNTTKLSWYGKILEEVAKRYGFSTKDPFYTLPEDIVEKILYGTGDEAYLIEFDSTTFKGKYKTTFEGVIPNIERRYKETSSDYVRSELEQYMVMRECRFCEGKRLKKESLSVKVEGMSIIEICQKSVEELLDFFKNLEFKSKVKDEVSKPIKKEIIRRLQYMVSVGLPYLTLSRSAQTLSGGEAQRIRLASQVGSGLSGVTYVLDEPSIGLHSRDTEKLIETIKSLRDAENTVIVVEHDKQTIKESDWIVDFGPKAGESGGRVVFEGTLDDIIKDENSLTGQYLSGKKSIPVPKLRRKYSPKDTIEILGASEHNLKNINCKIPLGLFVVVTGVSGSGKSTLVNDILAKALMKKFYNSKEEPGKHQKILGMEKCDKVVIVDQEPIGKTPRSNPATYTGIFSIIRKVFSEVPMAKARGCTPGNFSFNVKGGRCETCKGDGVIRVEMQFLPDVFVKCDACDGKRYNQGTLEILYKGKNISEVLEMTVDEALCFFSAIPILKRRIQTLKDVGLGYIKLGQPANTLSGGESQRIKLATELSKKSTGSTFYILDEPTTGLHFDDIKKLLIILHTLVDQGNTVLVIEHDLDVIKTADWVIDLGPEGGDGGGEIVAVGTPEEVSKNERSYTGKFLKKVLSGVG